MKVDDHQKVNEDNRKKQSEAQALRESQREQKTGLFDTHPADPERIAGTLARLEFASLHSSIPTISVDPALRTVCYGLRGFAELRAQLEKMLTRGGAG